MGDETTGRPFAWGLGAIAVVALVVRVAYVLVAQRDFDPGGDAFFYHAGANLLADGRGFISPFGYELGQRVQAAEHPPLYVVFLAIPSVLGMKTVLAHLVWSCVAGTATVVLVGLLGRAVCAPRVGLVAAAIFAVYPNAWAPDGMMQAETLSMFFAALVVLLAYHYVAAPSAARLTFVAGAAALGALARSELLLFVPFLVIPLALLTRSRSWGTRTAWTAVSLGVAVAILAPWTIYNASRFERPVLLSTQVDPLLASANCDSVYYGRFAGYFDINCALAVDADEDFPEDYDQSQRGPAYRHEAFDYVSDHTSRLPYVVGVRVLRSAGLYKPAQYVRDDSFFEGRDRWVSWSALIAFYVVGALAVAGAIVGRRRSLLLWPLAVPIGVYIVTVVTMYASTRFRSTAEPSIVVYAAIALDALWQRWSGVFLQRNSLQKNAR